MTPIKFPEENVKKENNQLPTYLRQDGLLVNCFQLNDKDLISLNMYRKLWIHHYTISGALQPYNIVAIDDYFSNVIHTPLNNGFIINDSDELQLNEEVEDLVNDIEVLTPNQNLYIHMAENYGLNLTHKELLDIVVISKEI